MDLAPAGVPSIQPWGVLLPWQVGDGPPSVPSLSPSLFRQGLQDLGFIC